MSCKWRPGEAGIDGCGSGGRRDPRPVGIAPFVCSPLLLALLAVSVITEAYAILSLCVSLFRFPVTNISEWYFMFTLDLSTPYVTFLSQEGTFLGSGLNIREGKYAHWRYMYTYQYTHNHTHTHTCLSLFRERDEEITLYIICIYIYIFIMQKKNEFLKDVEIISVWGRFHLEIPTKSSSFSAKEISELALEEWKWSHLNITKCPLEKCSNRRGNDVRNDNQMFQGIINSFIAC